MNSKRLSEIKNKLKGLLKKKEVIDVILFGSAITGNIVFDENEEEVKGICIPENTPGLKFYTSSDASVVCGQASTQCVVTFEKGISGEKECKDNCQCLEDDWLDDRIGICESLGDCGSKTNFVGAEGYDKGYKITKKKLNVAELFLPLLKFSSYVLFGEVDLASGDIRYIEGKGFYDTDTGKLVTREVGKNEETPLPAAGGSSFLSELFNTGVGTWGDAIISAAQYAGIAYAAGTYLIGPLLGMNKDQSQDLGIALATGFGLGKFLAVAGGQGGFWADFAGNPGIFPWLVKNYAITGIGTAIVVFLLLYKEESQQVVTFECLPWEAPAKGENCENQATRRRK